MHRGRKGAVIMSARDASGGWNDRWFDVVNWTILSGLLVAILYPLYFILISSFSSAESISGGGVWLYPEHFSLDGYIRIFQDERIWNGYARTLLYTTLGTTINVALTVTGGYALSRKDLVGRNVFVFLIVFTMFFRGGLIPTYLLVKELGMVNTIWSMVIPNAIAVYNLIIVRTFFQSTIPLELLESAKIDGASNTRFFLRIALPLSKPIIAVMVLLYAVGHWNSFFQALIYLNDRSLFPLQIILRDILVQSQVQIQMVTDVQSMADEMKIAEQIKYGVVIVASVPMLLLYPFLQKYFVKGFMIGSIKG
jgi:putative aldouronate transport system permease protein